MSIKVKESMMVRPSKETPKGSLWLSKLDMIIRTPYSHTHLLFVYHPIIPITDNTKTNFFDTKIMKEALSKALVHFYPMAGRLKFNEENGRYEIDCNAEGALFVEAEATTVALAELGEPELGKLVFPRCDYSGGLSSFPLLLVQLTRFKCGGVCLGFAPHHHVADGVSHFHFINSWARLARGLDLDLLPVHDRATYLAPRHPPIVKFQHLEYEPPLPPTHFPGDMGMAVESTFKLTKEQVNTLKERVEAGSGYKVSRFVVQAAHIWRSACKARGLADEEDVKLLITVDGRSRLMQTLPQGYCGNVYFLAACVEKSGDVTSKPVWYAASKIHEALKKMNDIEYLRSAIDYVESQPDYLTSLLRGPQTTVCPNLRINSWVRLPTHEADFGWGRPKFVGAIGIKCEGQTKIMKGEDEDGTVLVAIKLFPPHMELFKKYLYNLDLCYDFPSNKMRLTSSL